MPAVIKRILIPADVRQRPQLEQALQADGWSARAYHDVRDVEDILAGEPADAVILRGAGNVRAETELVKAVRHLAPEIFVIGLGAGRGECDTALGSESSPQEVAVAARLGAALREVRVAERRLREELKAIEEQNRSQVERIRQLEQQCRTLQEWAREAQEMAVHDELTGLHNRRYFVQAADREWERARRTNSRFALAMVEY